MRRRTMMESETLEPMLAASVQIAELRADLKEAKARLADIEMGAEMMLHPACNLTGAMLGYVREVKRVSGTPL
jgi:hypothetical protein